MKSFVDEGLDLDALSSSEWVRPSARTEAEYVKMFRTAAAFTCVLLAAAATISNNPMFGALAISTGATALYAWWQETRPEPRAPWLAVVLAVSVAAYGPFQQGPTLSMALVGVAAFAAISYIFVSRHHWPYLGVMASVWLIQLPYSADMSATIGAMTMQLLVFLGIASGSRRIAQTIQEVNAGYRLLFDRAPVSLWREDFSKVGEWLDGLRRDGIVDLRAYLAANPEAVDFGASLINVTDVNEAAMEMLGANSRDQLTGRLDAATIVPAARPSFVEPFVAIWEGRNNTSTEVRGARLDGTPIRGFLQWNAPPSPTGLARSIVSITDLTDVAEIQRQLDRTERRHAAMVQNVSDVIWTMDQTGIITYMSPAVEQALRVGAGELIGRNALEIMHPGDVDRVLEAAQTTQPGASTPAVEHRSRALDTEPWVDFETRATNLIDDPFVNAWVLTSRVITERKRTEAELRRRERQYRLLAENASDLIVSADAEGRWRYVSPSSQSVLGYAPEELVGSTVFEIAVPEERELFEAQFAATLREDDVQETVHRARRKDGSIIWLEFNSKAIRDATTGEVIEIHMAARDITLRRRAEIELREAVEAAEIATDAKSQFLANMSHEIRTPMNAILGMTELALGTDLTAEQQEYLEMTRRSVDGLVTLVNDILDLSKIEAGRMELESVLFSLRDTVGDTMRTLAVAAAEKGLVLEQAISDEVPDAVIGDPGRLRQVLFNLVGNAIKFTNVGRVVVAARVEEVDGDGVTVHFSVEDTGIGIAEDHKQHIFEAFAQADGSITRRHGGTGLGLTITSQIVELMDGEIWLESQVGHGSTFHFTARMRQLLGDGDAAIYSEREEGQLVIAVVSGDNAIRRNIAAVLRTARALPLAFDSAHSLVSAVESGINDSLPDAVVVACADDEAALCESILDSDGVAAKLPVVVAPAVGERGDAGRFRKLGVRGYLPRPLAPAELGDVLRAAVAMPPEQVGVDIITRHWLRERRPSLNVLVADDSPTNRMLAVRLLQKRGHRAFEVHDGRQAVEATTKHDFDVVLMDLQMPELDGLGATAEIRAAEIDGDRRLPIVALTAHAMESARKRCIAAGMDGYISKPFVADELYATIEQLADGNPLSDPIQVAGPSIDPDIALERVEGDAEFYAEITRIFLEEYPTTRESLNAAVDSGDWDGVARWAHKLAGNLGSLAAQSAYEAAQTLKRSGQSGEPDEVASAWRNLARELERLEPELAAVVATDGASLAT